MKKSKLVLAASIISLAAAGLAFADVTGVLLPIFGGSYSDWTPSSGASHYVLVDESVCNGNSDYNHTNTSGNRDSYSVNLSSIPNYSTITKVEITPCASKNGNGGSSVLNVFYRFDGVDSADAGNYSLTGTTPVDLAATAFSGLSHVKLSDSNLQIGAVYSSGSKGARLSRIAAVLTYDLPAPPAAPSDLTVSATTTTAVLNWVDNASTEESFRVERGTNGIDFVEINSTAANVTTYSDSGLAASTTYYYRVRARNAGGDSAYSNVASVTTP